jgi:hypothetical protein
MRFSTSCQAPDGWFDQWGGSFEILDGGEGRWGVSRSVRGIGALGSSSFSEVRWDTSLGHFNQKFKNQRARAPAAPLFREEVVEGLYGGVFVVFDVEDGIELGDVENVVDFRGDVEEFEFSAGVADGSEATDQFSDTGAVDIVDVRQVEDDFLNVFGDEVVDGVAEGTNLRAEDDAAVDVEDGDFGDFAGLDS